MHNHAISVTVRRKGERYLNPVEHEPSLRSGAGVTVRVFATQVNRILVRGKLGSTTVDLLRGRNGEYRWVSPIGNQMPAGRAKAIFPRIIAISWLLTHRHCDIPWVSDQAGLNVRG